jgi:hypothetical protein
VDITAVTGCCKFGTDIACFKLFAYTAGETVNCKKKLIFQTKQLNFISKTTARINCTDN